MREKDNKYMKKAIELAKKRRGKTSPNPMVGAVIVKNNKIISKGYHKKAGKPHAEAIALEKAGKQAKNSTLYVNLEPCNHHGKTPPCTEKIIDSDVSRVVIGTKDPNPKSGNGIKKLKENEVEVSIGVKEKEAKKLNEVFFKYTKEEIPFVISKAAMTMDGKIASKTGDSKWISNEESRNFSHKLRDRYDAILVGANTVIQDNPRLTTRLNDKEGSNPIRVILDYKLRIPVNANVLSEDGEIIISTSLDSKTNKRKKWKKLRENNNLNFFYMKDKGVKGLLNYLGEEGITSLLVEGGSKVNWSFFSEDLVDKIFYFIAPKIVGGSNAVPLVGGEGFESIKDSLEVEDIDTENFGDDILIVGYPHR